MHTLPCMHVCCVRTWHHPYFHYYLMSSIQKNISLFIKLDKWYKCNFTHYAAITKGKYKEETHIHANKVLINVLIGIILFQLTCTVSKSRQDSI